MLRKRIFRYPEKEKDFPDTFEYFLFRCNDTDKEETKMEIIEWLCLNINNNFHGDDEYIFRTICEYGYFEFAKTLFENIPNINIHALDEYAFRKCCLKGYTKIAQWLYSLDKNLNVRASDDEAFIWSCKNEYVKIAAWLTTLCEYYHLECGEHGDVIFKVMKNKKKKIIL